MDDFQEDKDTKGKQVHWELSDMKIYGQKVQ